MIFPLRDDVRPNAPVPWVTWGLLTANVVMFLYHHWNPALTYGWSLVPREIVTFSDLVGLYSNGSVVLGLYEGPDPVQLTLLSSMFMHGGWLHLGGNLLYLWIFGDNVEERMGASRFLLFYLGCGVMASLCQIILAPLSIIPILGASGAIAGVLGAYLILFPGNRVQTLVFIVVVPVPAVLVLGWWGVMQVVGGFGTLGSAGENGGVAYAAHVGGFAAGLWWGRRYRPLFRRSPS